MVKRINESTGEDSFAESPSKSPSKKHKKHKKHKHRKHEKTKHEEQDDTEKHDMGEDIKPIKLKIKIGSEQIKPIEEDSPSASISQERRDKKKKDKSEISSTWKAKEDVFRTKKSDEDTSDEEKEWLHALEKGTLDDHGMIAPKKSEKLMTARQRALLHGKQEEPLMELPSGYKHKGELSEEQTKKKEQKATQRREMAAKKHEKDKKQTLERLLRKQDSKGKGVKGRQHKRNTKSGFRYINSLTQTVICIPEGKSLYFPAQKAPSIHQPVYCGVKGCTNLKKYSCSKTGVPLCSLKCYKTNLAEAQN